jgi:signal transduction histidine kinase
VCDHRAFVEVKDQGRGIPEEDLKYIFEPFKRVTTQESRKIEGTGLGLAIVKHIMDAHHGQIEVESEVGTGSKFKLWFSLANE